MGLRGPKPKGAAHHIMRGNRPSRHGPKPDATPPPETSEPDPEVERRTAELRDWLARSKGKLASR